MAQVGVAQPAAHFGADHEVTRVGFFLDVVAAERARKAGPAAACVVFVAGAEQRLAGDDIDINPFFFVVPVLACKRPLGRVVLRHLVLHRGQPALQFLWILRAGPVAFQKVLASGAFAVQLIMARIFLVILLMIFLGRIKRRRRQNRCDDRLVKATALRKLLLRSLCLQTLLLIMVKNRGAIRFAAIMKLAAFVRRVDLLPI
ncbi:hypothetical protein D3C74_223990 [compost metagenome]